MIDPRNFIRVGSQAEIHAIVFHRTLSLIKLNHTVRTTEYFPSIKHGRKLGLSSVPTVYSTVFQSGDEADPNVGLTRLQLNPGPGP